MNKIAGAILNHRKLILGLFLVAVIISAVLLSQVKINYKITDYLPEEAQSMRALNVMQEEYSEALPNLQLAVPRLSLGEALALKEDLAAKDYVKSLQWLDDVADVSQALETLDPEIIDAFYQDGEARYSLVLESENYDAAIQDLCEGLPADVAMSGQALDLALSNRATSTEIAKIMIFALPLAFLILLWSTHSFVEPLIFLISILVAILLNSGTNYFLGEISFVTQAVAAVLQLAVSLDYAIFLLNRFNTQREQGLEIIPAMQAAMVQAFSSITVSASTTFCGFLSLVFMRFLLGRDLGIVLAKGIFFSLLTTFLLLPVLICLSYKIIDKTTHRSFLPQPQTLQKFAAGVLRFTPVILILILLSSWPLYHAQDSLNFIYGMRVAPEGSTAYEDAQHIAQKFGDEQIFVYLAPQGNPQKEEALSAEFLRLPYVKKLVSYSETVGYELPLEMLDSAEKAQFFSDNYSRFILYVGLPTEGEASFSAVEELLSLTANMYPDADNYWIGESFSLYEMKNIIREDNVVVNGLIILFVGVIILLAFRSISIPLILVLTIEYAIWCNLAVLQLTGTPLNYIGYLVVSTIQLGATVDYGILLAENYLGERYKHTAREAATQALAASLPAIMPPALILSGIGYLLMLNSSLPIVADIGMVLGRGALLSLLAVVFILPNLLKFLDPFIRYSSLAPHSWQLLDKSLKKAEE